MLTLLKPGVPVHIRPSLHQYLLSHREHPRLSPNLPDQQPSSQSSLQSLRFPLFLNVQRREGGAASVHSQTSLAVVQPGAYKNNFFLSYSHSSLLLNSGIHLGKKKKLSGGRRFRIAGLACGRTSPASRGFTWNDSTTDDISDMSKSAYFELHAQ